MSASAQNSAQSFIIHKYAKLEAIIKKNIFLIMRVRLLKKKILFLLRIPYLIVFSPDILLALKY